VHRMPPALFAMVPPIVQDAELAGSGPSRRPCRFSSELMWLKDHHGVSGWIVRSLFATMCQFGFDLQTVPSTFLSEQIGDWRYVGTPNELLLFLTQVSGKVLDVVWFRPDATVCNFDVRQDVRDREFSLQALRCFVCVWRECGAHRVPPPEEAESIC